jgi:hypothetical protein
MKHFFLLQITLLVMQYLYIDYINYLIHFYIKILDIGVPIAPILWA